MSFPKLISVDSGNIYLLEYFLENLEEAKESFRYFNKRPLSIINSHLCTFLLIAENCQPIAYGHLDKEDDIVWLGIAVNSKSQGKGIGKLMMSHLIRFAQNNNINNIQLSVDIDNVKARNLYEKMGFICSSSFKKYALYNLSFN
ncbi:MAG: GNAT family N-acetyltransferase [Chitinophagales bacterium]